MPDFTGFGAGAGSPTRMRTSPIPVQRTRRSMDIRNLTSLPTGKMVPLAVMPLLREDALQSCTLRCNFEMLETVEILMNAVNVRVLAYLVPNLAFPRFSGMDELNRSYQKVPIADGATVTPYFQSIPFNKDTNQILMRLGKHSRAGQGVNTAYNEAYNIIWNMRAKNRSPDLTPRLLTDTTLAKAFWMHQRFGYIVPDFDQAIIDGEVPLNITAGAVSIKGTDTTQGYGATKGRVGTFRLSVPGTETGLLNSGTSTTIVAGQANPGATTNMMFYSDLTKIIGELSATGITVSLSNIELARKTQAFAALRRQYHGLDDDYLIDLLMNGITIPEQQMKQPILLADRSTIFGMSKRYASSADDLTASVVNGGTFIDLRLRTPVVPTGGIVMVVAEITPEQLWERQMDPYLHTVDQELLPEFLRDTLDPEKVEVVQNQFVDMDHDSPSATFGYAPLNYKWQTNGPGIGGKFYRPDVNAAFDEDRQRIWAVETENPTLGEDFYLCTNMHDKPFVVTNQDNFEVVTRGMASITGLTVFGNLLIEASDDYEEVMSEADQDRIVKPVSMEAPDTEPSDADLNSLEK